MQVNIKEHKIVINELPNEQGRYEFRTIIDYIEYSGAGDFGNMNKHSVNTIKRLMEIIHPILRMEEKRVIITFPDNEFTDKIVITLDPIAVDNIQELKMELTRMRDEIASIRSAHSTYYVIWTAANGFISDYNDPNNVLLFALRENWHNMVSHKKKIPQTEVDVFSQKNWVGILKLLDLLDCEWSSPGFCEGDCVLRKLVDFLARNGFDFVSEKCYQFSQRVYCVMNQISMKGSCAAGWLLTFRFRGKLGKIGTIPNMLVYNPETTTLLYNFNNIISVDYQ